MKYLIFFFPCIFFAANSAFALELRSPAFGAKGEIPYIHTCQDSQDLSLPLTWSDVPLGTRSFAIIMEERTGSITRVHWVIYDIPASMRQLNPGIARTRRLPNQILQGTNDFSIDGYSGPCPKDTVAHHYYITLYALDTANLLNVNDVRKENLVSAMRGHIIAEYQLVGRYTRIRQ
ncbi:MAG: YbhB/YbcL family Raf kinase inhibitor-like protein [Candidatus Omnitrophota bacterium]|nr:YbhB/YbcL family Raf kinase inhibitor-like protein [Candidatus Omnitrophota bacterium]